MCSYFRNVAAFILPIFVFSKCSGHNSFQTTGPQMSSYSLVCYNIWFGSHVGESKLNQTD